MALPSECEAPQEGPPPQQHSKLLQAGVARCPLSAEANIQMRCCAFVVKACLHVGGAGEQASKSTRVSVCNLDDRVIVVVELSADLPSFIF